MSPSVRRLKNLRHSDPFGKPRGKSKYFPPAACGSAWFPRLDIRDSGAWLARHPPIHESRIPPFAGACRCFFHRLCRRFRDADLACRRRSAQLDSRPFQKRRAVPPGKIHPAGQGSAGSRRCRTAFPPQRRIRQPDRGGGALRGQHRHRRRPHRAAAGHLGPHPRAAAIPRKARAPA